MDVTRSACLFVLGTPVYAACTRCGVSTLKYGSSGVCSYCINYQAVRKRAAEFANTPLQVSQTKVVLGKRKAEVLREPRKLLPPPACTEFQTRSGMYEALLNMLKTFYGTNTSSKTHPSYISFHGSYSIIADPKVSGVRQLLLVSQDLQKIVKLPHQ